MSRSNAFGLLLPAGFGLDAWEVDRHGTMTTTVLRTETEDDTPAAAGVAAVGVDAYRHAEGGVAVDVWWALSSPHGTEDVHRETVLRLQAWSDEVAARIAVGLLAAVQRLMSGMPEGAPPGTWLEPFWPHEDEVRSFEALAEFDWENIPIGVEPVLDDAGHLGAGDEGIVLWLRPRGVMPAFEPIVVTIRSSHGGVMVEVSGEPPGVVGPMGAPMAVRLQSRAWAAVIWLHRAEDQLLGLQTLPSSVAAHLADPIGASFLVASS